MVETYEAMVHLFIIIIMQGPNSKWEKNFRHFYKLLGFEELEMEETLDETNRSEIVRRPAKGIKLVQEHHLNYSLILKQTESHRLQRKWIDYLRRPYQRSIQPDLLALIARNTYSAKKVLPWLSQNKLKITTRLFNLKRSQLRAMHNPNNTHLLERPTSSIMELRNKVTHPNNFEPLAAFLLIRQDLVVGDLFLNMSNAVLYYFSDSPVIAMTLLSSVCCSNGYLPFLLQDPVLIQNSIQKICLNIRNNCPSVSFLLKNGIALEGFVSQWIFTFWSTVADNESPVYEKILYYLLMNQADLQSISRVCEAVVVGLRRMLNQGSTEKSVYTLSRPKIFLDEDVFVEYLFSSK